MNKKIKIILALTLLAVAACNKQLSPLLTNPSVPTPAAADADLYLNNLQISFKNFYQDATDFGDALTRQEVMYGPTYFNAYTPSSFDDIWNQAYMNVFLTANTMIAPAEAKAQVIHAGIAQILKAYTMMTMVDYFGDIPYSQADLGVGNTNPVVDKGAAVYDSAVALLDSGIANMGRVSAETQAPSNDLFYNGDTAKWHTLANTLLLKAYIQTRLVDNTAAAKITALINGGNLITKPSQDFVFSYSAHNANPDSRCSHYISNYGTTTGAADYMGTYFMWCLRDEKGQPDPRTSYYIYRQCDDVTNDSRLPTQTQTQFAIPCLYRTDPYPAGVPYCIVDLGYWGRDHGNNEGIPPDGGLRSTWGVYPAGGEFDAGQNQAVGTGSGYLAGAGGDGINPIWLSSYTNFLLAEAALTLGTPGDPQAYLLAGVNASLNKVAAFPAAIGYQLPTSDPTLVMSATSIQNYVTLVQNLYQSAASPAAQLEVVMKEYYLAAWGNGVEVYNNYRRTGMPNNMQPAVQAAGLFIRSFFYASVYVNYNKTAVQKTATNVKVFWDPNPDNFVY